VRISEDFVAGAEKRFHIAGDYFCFDSVPAGSASVLFFRNGRRLPDDLIGVIGGWGIGPKGGFDLIEVTSSITQTVTFYVTRGPVRPSIISGSVAVSNFPAVQPVSGPLTDTQLRAAAVPVSLTEAGFTISGIYSLAVDTGDYTFTTANAILFSFRWTDANNLALLLLAKVHVIATAFTTAGVVERQLTKVRGWGNSDTGGTSVNPAADQNELRTSFATSLAADIRVSSGGAALVAGSPSGGTPSTIGSASGWMSAVGAVIGDRAPVDLFNASNVFIPTANYKRRFYPFTMAVNEGFRIRLGNAETASTRRTFINVVWAQIANADFPA
jgi:hypothetical protein